MLLSLHQNAGQKSNIKVANRSFENVAQFKYLGMTLTNKNLFHEENNSRLHKGNANYHSVQNLVFLSMPKKLTYKTIILPVALYGCETWTSTLGEE
jgi:hypothetical protein